jgi:ABC-2 type transport system permease protein
VRAWPAILLLTIRKARAFIQRDFRVESSYKFAFVFELATSVFPVFSFYFIGKLVDTGGAGSLEKYGGRYFPFAMVGVAFSQYYMVALGAFSGAIRRSQMAGCLEAMLSTRTGPGAVVVYSSLYSFLIKTVHILLVFAVGGLFLSAHLGNANLPAALLTVALTVAVFGSLGIFSAAFIVLLKKGDPIEWLFGAASSLLGGAAFPLAIMPGWMRHLAAFIPITYSLEAMRLSVLRGYTVSMLWKPLSILAAMAVVLLPLSVWSFTGAVEKGRRDGTLMHY